MMMKRPTQQWKRSSAGVLLTVYWSFVVLKVFGFGHVSGEMPHFVAEPQSVFWHQGSTVALECNTEPSNARIGWLYNGSLITTKWGTAARGGRLVLDSSSKWEEGPYQCIANNSDGAVLSSAAYVGKAYIADFEDDLLDRDIQVAVKNTAVIPCATPKGSPPTVTEFEKNSTKLFLSSRHRILPSGNLQIANVGKTDEGVYRCIAINPVTGERRSAPNVVTLTVFEPVNVSQPQFTWTPQSHLEIICGQNLTLECVAEGWPVPRLTWKRYGGVLPEGRSMTIWGNLVINNVQKQDEGTYICQAEVNNTHRQENVAFIDVLEPPTITTPLSDQNVTESDRVTFSCQTMGSQKISISWFHNTVPVIMSPQVTLSNGSLTLRDVQLRHSGVYQCFAENPFGSVHSFARLIVKSKMEKVDADAGHQNEMQNVAPSGDLVSSSAVPTGPHRGKKLPKSSSGHPRASSPPAVAMVTDAVKTENSVPDGPATLGPPSKPTVSKTSETSVLLSWTVTQNGSLPVVFFKVQYKEIIDSKRSRWQTRDEEISPASRSYDVLNLKSGATYQFRIAAVYSNHDNKISPVSDRFTLKTGSPASGRSRSPITSPMIVDVRANVSSLVVVWQYQPIERVIIDGFNVFYKPYGSDVSYLSVKVTGSSSRKTAITGLQPDTLYSIRMTCFNADGESNSSISVVRKTVGLFESSQTPSDREDLVDPAEDQHPPTTTTMRSVYATNRVNTHASNELLFVVLGVVLGIMMLILCVVMVMCAFKQRQQRRLMAALEGRRKFHDPSKTIYVGSQMKSASEGSFLLNGVGVPPRKTATNGYLATRGNGVAPTNANPMSEYELRDAADYRTNEEEVPLKTLSSVKHDGLKGQYVMPRASCDDIQRPSSVIFSGSSADQADVHDPELQQRPSVDACTPAISSQPPDDLPSISRPKDVPFQQLSLKSSRSSSDYRHHNFDCFDSYPSSSHTNTSPDHIPRLHECQLLYRSPEHTRRSRDRSRGRHEQVSDRSLSASSQVSSGHLRPAVRHLNHANIKHEPGDQIGSKVTGIILPAETNSSDMDNRRECVSENTHRLKESDSIPDQGESLQKDLSGSLEFSHENSAPGKTSQRNSSSTDRSQNNS